MAAALVPVEGSDRCSRRDWVDTRSFWRKIVDYAVSFFRQLSYSATTFYYWSCPSALPAFSPSWKEDSKGLFVLIHGLRNDPASWYAQLQLLERELTIDVLAPVVHRRGLCSLKDAEAPLLEQILDYTEKHPRKPVCLLGTSNGGRIAVQLEISLRKASPSTPVKVSSVAGVILGSSRMAFVDWIPGAQYFYPDELRGELRYQSEVATRLLEELNAPLPEECAPRSYEFYATTEDLSIPDLDSSLPDVPGKDALFFLKHGESHGSIVAAVAEDQIASCTQWMRQYT